MKRANRSSRPAFETLETRQLLSAAISSALSPSTSQLVYGDVVGAAPTAAQTITFTNTSLAPLTIPAGGFSIAGASADQFHITSSPTTDSILAPGASVAVGVNFGATLLGPQGAMLQVATADPAAAPTSVALRGLGTKGEQGDLEPSLQWILDTYQIGSRTGDSDPVEPTLDLAPLANDEVIAPLFTKAGPGSVSIIPIAVYSNSASPALTLGYYTKSSPSAGITKKTLYTVPAADVQTLNPRVTGASTFDPGLATFGLFSTWAAQKNRTVYSENARNTFISPASLQQMFKVYPLTNADGSIVPNAYVVGNEEAFNHDYQDGVYIIRNVKPAQVFPAYIPTSQTTGLVLVNADTGKDIGPLVDGAVIDYSVLGTSHISVRATIEGKAASVKFVDGTFSHIENSAPYSINGDSGPNYTAWSAPLGDSTLIVTPYTFGNASGNAGVAIAVHLTVQLTTPIPPPPLTPPAPIIPDPTTPPPSDPAPTTPTDPTTPTTPTDPTTPTTPTDPSTPVTNPPADPAPTTPTDPTTPPAPPVIIPPVIIPPVVIPPVITPPVVTPPVTPPPITPPPVVTPPPTPPAPVVYQAEQATLKGATVANTNGGYTAAGYADFQNNTGDSITWNVTAASAGAVTLTFRYANGAAANRALALKVNGVTVKPTLAFNATGAWTTWKTVTVTVQLAAGANSIALSTIGSNGANFDSMTVG